MFLPMFILAAVAGVLIGIIALPELQELFKFKQKLVLLIAILIMIILAVIIATSVHLDERVRNNSDTTRTVSLHWCLIESDAQCQTIVNELNNKSYASYTNGQIQKMSLYMPVTLIASLLNNFCTAFGIGLMLSYFIAFRRDFVGQ